MTVYLTREDVQKVAFDEMVADFIIIEAEREDLLNNQELLEKIVDRVWGIQFTVKENTETRLSEYLRSLTAITEFVPYIEKQIRKKKK